MTDPAIRHCDDLAARRTALRELIGAARLDLLFYAPRLEARLIEAPAIHDALQTFLLTSHRHRLRILVSEAAALVRDCPRLLALCRRLPSRAQLRVPSADAETLDETVLLADRPYALHRPANERHRHLFLAPEPGRVAALRQRTEELWEHGRSAAEFRELVI